MRESQDRYAGEEWAPKSVQVVAVERAQGEGEVGIKGNDSHSLARTARGFISTVSSRKWGPSAPFHSLASLRCFYYIKVSFPLCIHD